MQEVVLALYGQSVKLSFDQRKVSGADEYLANAVAVPEPFIDPVNPAKAIIHRKPRSRLPGTKMLRRKRNWSGSLLRNGLLTSLWALRVGPTIDVQVIRKCFHLSAI